MAAERCGSEVVLRQREAWSCALRIPNLVGGSMGTVAADDEELRDAVALAEAEDLVEVEAAACRAKQGPAVVLDARDSLVGERQRRLGGGVEAPVAVRVEGVERSGGGGGRESRSDVR